MSLARIYALEIMYLGEMNFMGLTNILMVAKHLLYLWVTEQNIDGMQKLTRRMKRSGKQSLTR